jgi:2-dehydropantoate 2-reductase
MGNNLSGPDEFTRILGKDRVMIGAVYAAGKRDGSLIRAMVVKSVAAPFGEVDGTTTPRLKRLAGIFRRAGFKVETSTDIVDFQTTHAVGVALIAKLTIKHGCDTSALARWCCPKTRGITHLPIGALSATLAAAVPIL